MAPLWNRWQRDSDLWCLCVDLQNFKDVKGKKNEEIVKALGADLCLWLAATLYYNFYLINIMYIMYSKIAPPPK